MAIEPFSVVAATPSGAAVTRTPLIAVDLDPSRLGADRALRAAADPAVWLEIVLELEAAGVGLVTLADAFGATDGIARVDAIMCVAWLAARTTRIGLMAAADTTVSEPFLLAAQIATADFISGGRAGWLVQVSGRAEDAGYVGPREVAVGADAWDEAGEYVEIVRALWDSWEDGAEIRDVPGRRFIDSQRIHHIAYEGVWLSVMGPSITPRSPQAQAPVAVALGDGGERAALLLGLAGADLLFLGSGFDADALRRTAGEGRQLTLVADVPVAEASVGRVGELLSDGFDGIRLIPTELPGDLTAIVDLAGALGLDADPPPSVGSPPTAPPEVPASLRDRLGLARPENRFAGERS